MSDSCVVGMKVGEARFLFSQVTIIGELVSFDYFGLTEGKIGCVREQPTALSFTINQPSQLTTDNERTASWNII